MKYEIVYKKNLKDVEKDYFKAKIKSIFVREDFINNLKTIIDSTDEDNNTIVFSIGGDGTFLEAFNLYGINAIYIPINAGTLGFYTSWNKENIDSFETKFISLEAPLLEVKVNDEIHYCINEMTIINPINTQIIEIFINNIHFEHFRGTGICISTPTGSTGYNKSLGGALISPENRLFQLVKMAPIDNIKYRTISNAIILGEKDEVSFPDNKYFLDSLLTIDRQNFSLKNVENLKVSLSTNSLKILTNNRNFWTKVHEKFIG